MLEPNTSVSSVPQTCFVTVAFLGKLDMYIFLCRRNKVLHVFGSKGTWLQGDSIKLLGFPPSF